MPASTDASTQPVPNARPDVGDLEAAAVAAVLQSWWLGMGPRAAELEQGLRQLLRAPDVIALSSGTAALHVGLLVAGVVPGDEVVLPSLTFCSTAQAVLACGATPIFCEVDAGTLCVRPEHLAEHLSPRTRAVIPVLYGGRAVDLGDITAELKQRGIAVVEDAAHAFGSRQADRMVGATGATTCFSFDPIKNITCGEGGALVPATEEQGRRARRIRSLGIDAEAYGRYRSQGAAYAITDIGFRYHMSDINAAIGLVQLSRFPALAQARERLWRSYAARLAEVPRARLIDLDIEHSVPFNCVVRIPDRDRVLARLRAEGIGVGVHYTPNHLQPVFDHRGGPLPITERLAAEIMSLPLYPVMTTQDVDRVVDRLQSALDA